MCVCVCVFVCVCVPVCVLVVLLSLPCRVIRLSFFLVTDLFAGVYFLGYYLFVVRTNRKVAILLIFIV